MWYLRRLSISCDVDGESFSKPRIKPVAATGHFNKSAIKLQLRGNERKHDKTLVVKYAVSWFSIIFSRHELYSNRNVTKYIVHSEITEALLRSV